MLTITKDMGEFAAAHTLNYHDGGCANLHGHNYRVEVTLLGTVADISPDNPQSGMIMDFTKIKDLYKTHVHSLLDHAMIFAEIKPSWYQAFVNLAALNMAECNPNRASDVDAQENARAVVDKYLGKVAHLSIPETTAEHLARWIFKKLSEELMEHAVKQNNTVVLYAVTVYETAGSWATYSER